MTGPSCAAARALWSAVRAALLIAESSELVRAATVRDTAAMSASALLTAARFCSLSSASSVVDVRSTLPSTVMITFSSRAVSDALLGISGSSPGLLATSGAEPRAPPANST